MILTGINGDNCVLMTAIDAYVRDFELHVPADCTASIVRTHNTDALAYMKRMLHADTRAGAMLDLRRLRRSTRRSRS